MRIHALIVAFIIAGLPFGALAQQSVPDAPQPREKQAAKPPDPPPPPPPAKDDNAFPEDVSKKAAEAVADSKQPGTASDNAFPEAQSQAAAKAAGSEQALPPGVSSSRSEDAAPINDPARSKKDNEVGAFYLKTGDYQGALLRYKDATTTDPTNVNAIFGLAEAQRMLKKNADSARNYQLYLDIVPNGPKAKQALKALKEIQAGK